LRSQRALEAEKEFNRQIIETSPVGITIYNENGDCISANAAIARQIGASREQVLTQNYHRLESWQRYGVYDLARRAIHSESPLSGVFRVITSFGKHAWLGITFCALRIDAREHLMMMTSDLTEVKQAELALIESERKFRLLVEQASDGIFLCAADGRYTEVNEAWLNMLGYSRDEALQRDLAAFIDEDELRRIPLRFAHLGQGEPVLEERRLRRKDGRSIVAEISARILPGGEILGIVRDITARKKMESELIELNITLEKRVAERTAELEAFAYSVSHDLRAPLRHISGFAAIVIKANEGKLDSVSVEHLRRIAAGAKRMSELIDDLLKLSQVSRQELRRRTLDLSEVAAGVLGSLAQAHPEREVDLVIAPAMIVDGDPGLMHIVMENLLGNAWKFTSRAARARIEVGRVERNGEQVYFVRDNGAGFDMAYAAKLFGAFQRLHSPDEFEGTGIGLSIVQRIVARHAGRIWAEAAIGKGATFHFTLGPGAQRAAAGLTAG